MKNLISLNLNAWVLFPEEGIRILRGHLKRMRR